MINGDMNHIPSTLSKSCKDFIHRVLTANPDKRPTVDEIIQHRWLKEAVDYRFDYNLDHDLHVGYYWLTCSFSVSYFIRKLNR